MKKIIFTTITLVLVAHGIENKSIQMNGFLDTFYVYDFNQPSNKRQDFLFNHNRHNEFNINLALIRFDVNEQNYRARIALQAGTYANNNYTDEKDSLKHINEAFVGVALDENQKLWLDGGVFSSHIGFESAVSLDNPTLTRSMVAENTPYFLSGVKLTYNPNQQWHFLAVVANGWQKIEKATGNSKLALGTQVLYTPNKALSLNYSTFVSYDEQNIDLKQKQRVLNNFYALIGLSDKVKLIAGLDIGFEEKNSKQGYNHWLVPTLIAKYKIDKKYSTAFRAEYFYDPYSIIIASSSSLGFKTFGLSSNIDYSVTKDIAFRCEARYLRASQKVLSQASRDNFFLTSSLALKF